MTVDLRSRQATRVHPMTARRVEVRAVDETTVARFGGHAAVFNVRTWIGPKTLGFWEQVAPGAFDKAIGRDDVRFLFNHDTNWVLARTSSGTLRLKTDSKGLAVDADMADTTQGRDLKVLMERGDVREMSFGFRIDKEKWEVLKDGTELRTIQDVTLYDVAVVAYPAYSNTDAGIRKDPPPAGSFNAKIQNDFRRKKLEILRKEMEIDRRPHPSVLALRARMNERQRNDRLRGL